MEKSVTACPSPATAGRRPSHPDSRVPLYTGSPPPHTSGSFRLWDGLTQKETNADKGRFPRMEESDSSLAFLRDLLHELKDPFAALYGGLELSGRSSPLTGPERDRLEASLRRNSHAMKRVLEDASLYLRLAGGGFSSKAAPVDAAAVLRQAAEDGRPHLETRSQSLSVCSPPLFLHIDGEALRRCLACMIGTISRVCSHGQALQLCLQVPENDLVEVQLKTALQHDHTTASGGSAESRGDFRERLVTQLAQRLEGQAWRTAATSWTLRFPYRPASLEPSAEAVSDHGPGRPRVLVVDDNRDGADTLSMWLEAQGYDVVTAYDGNRGWEEFESRTPDIGLFDVGLPGRNGYELAQSAREAGFRGTLVAITGYGQEQDRALALQAGFDHHMVKPVDLSLLGDLLRKERVPHVVVVEDNPVARQVLVLLLGKLGARVTGTGTAEEGLETIARQEPDLVICDLGLPGGLSGYDLARQLRTRGELPFSLVALTGDAAVARENALSAGFDQVLEKPADAEVLRALLLRR